MSPFFQYKTPFLTGLFFLFCQFNINSQDRIAESYLDTIGDFAAIYNGKIEAIYAVNVYKNLPYYGATDFVPGEVVYKDKYYPNQQLKLDLYKEQLLVLSPQRHFGIVLDSKDVQEAILYGRKFVWYSPEQSKDLKRGFYIQLHKGENMTLLCKVSMSLQVEVSRSRFSSKTRFYFLYNGSHYTVKNKNSFVKIFPKYKNQINQFAKEQKLKFGPDSENSLTLLAQYCENLYSGNF